MERIRRFIQNVSNFRRKKEDTLFAVIDPEKIKIGQKLIEEGLGVNFGEDALNRALYMACERGYTDWICMLLYYGANPNIPTATGGLPITAINDVESLPRQDYKFLRNILSLYTLDSRSLSLQTLIAAMREETSWFCKVLESVSEVVYDEDQDQDFVYDNALYIKPSNLKFFFEKFTCVFQYISEVLVAGGFLYILIKQMTDPFGKYVALDIDLIDIFLYNSCISKLSISELERCCCLETENCYCTFALRTDTMIVQSLSRESNFSEEEVTERVLLMMTHGLGVTLLDLEVVYTCYGYCDLFEILLHMDLEDHCTRYISPFISLYHDPRLTIESCFEDPLSLLLLLDLYNDTKLKQQCLDLLEEEHYCDYDAGVGFNNWCSFLDVPLETWDEADWYVLNILRGVKLSSRVRNMPPVQSLVELSRNVARKYIVDKFKIRSSRELYTVLNELPLDKLTKDTIKLRRKLY